MALPQTHTLNPTDAGSIRTSLAEVLRSYSEHRTANPSSPAYIYLIGYSTATITLGSAQTMGESGRFKTDLRNTRDGLISLGVAANRVVIVGVVAPDARKAGMIDALLTPVKLPVVVWRDGGLQTGDGAPGPDDGGTSVGIDPWKGEVETEVEISYEKFGIRSKLLKGKLTFKPGPDGLKEVSGNLVLAKQKLAEKFAKGAIQKVHITVKAEWKYDAEKRHVEAEIKLVLSAEVSLPSNPKFKIPIELLAVVNHHGDIDKEIKFTVYEW